MYCVFMSSHKVLAVLEAWIYCLLLFYIFHSLNRLFLQKRREEMERLEKERQAELRSYKNLMVADKMTSNKDIAAANKSLQELEEDFM